MRGSLSSQSGAIARRIAPASCAGLGLIGTLTSSSPWSHVCFGKEGQRLRLALPPVDVVVVGPKYLAGHLKCFLERGDITSTLSHCSCSQPNSSHTEDDREERQLHEEDAPPLLRRPREWAEVRNCDHQRQCTNTKHNAATNDGLRHLRWRKPRRIRTIARTWHSSLRPAWPPSGQGLGKGWLDSTGTAPRMPVRPPSGFADSRQQQP